MLLKATLIYRRTGNLRAVQLLLGHTKIESTVRYRDIDVDDALATYDVAISTAFGGKADMPSCTAHVCFWHKADIRNHGRWRCGEHGTCFSGLNWSVRALIVKINATTLN